MLRSLWPAGLVPAVIALAALALGADQPAAALLFSMLLLGLTAALLMLTGARPDLISLSWMLGAAALFAIALWRGWASSGAGEYASLMAGAGVFLIARNAALKPERAEALWALILILGAGLGFAAFIDFLLDPRTIFGFERAYHQSRLSAPFLSANTAATFYGMISLMGLASMLRAFKRGGRVDTLIQRLALPASALLICATCLFLSGSRAGISLFMVAVLALVAWDRLAFWRTQMRDGKTQTRNPRRNTLIGAFAGPALLIVLSVIIFGVSGGLYADRIEQGGLIVRDDARALMFARYSEGIWLAPILGSGLGGFAFINDFLATAGDARTITGQNAAHNVAFQWLLQAGLLGAAGAVAVTGLIVAKLRKGLLRRRSQRVLLRTILVIAIFVFSHGMVDYALEIPAVFWLFSLILGMGAGLADGGRSGARSQRSPWPIKTAVVTLLIVSASLSCYAGLDRNEAVRISTMSDAAFLALYSNSPELSGSAVRLESIGDRALRLERPDLALARAALNASLEIEPRNGKIWAKLAYTNYAIIPVIAGETEDALRQSYYLMPYADRQFIHWRLDFVANAWTGLPEDLRDAAVRESRIMPIRYQSRWRARVDLPSPADD